MNKTIDRIKIGFVALFALGAAGVTAYHLYWRQPAERCERSGNWWDPDTRTCGTVVYLPNITGRQPGEPRRTAPAAVPAQPAAPAPSA